MKRKYVIVGAGSRGIWYIEKILKDFSGTVDILAICDDNPGRLQNAVSKFKNQLPLLRSYDAGSYDQMLTEQQPDYVLVISKDCTHDEFICLALKSGFNVITEKPMTIDIKRCRRIIDAVQKSKGAVRVTFNYRYSPPRSQVKQLLMDNVIGKILSVEFQWLLDTHHGADYFRRWHRNKSNSGGLMVHKATHHFDLVNWWLSSVPVTVAACGDRVFYNETQAKRYGLEEHSDRCLTCPVKGRCNFFLDLTRTGQLKELYLDHELHDGYLRDQCIFSDEIDIEDTMNLAVQYKNGTFMSYALNAFAAYEGYRVAFNGTRGRLEHSCQESSYINGDGTVQGGLKPEATSIKVFPHFQTPYSVEINRGEGSHGGGDDVMFNDIFGEPKPDPLLRSANYVQGVYSILTGIAANESMATGNIIEVESLLSGLPEPGFPVTEDEDVIPYVPQVKHDWI